MKTNLQLNGEYSSKGITVSFNGKPVNVNKISANIKYKYGMRLMDVLFSKEEMAFSQLFETKRKCDKPRLDD